MVEIVIAIVLVGILSAVAVVGIGSLTDKGNDSACEASLDAAKAAAVVHLASTNSYPATLTTMTTGTRPALTLPSGVADCRQRSGDHGPVVDADDDPRSAADVRVQLTSPRRRPTN